MVLSVRRVKYQGLETCSAMKPEPTTGCGGGGGGGGGGGSSFDQLALFPQCGAFSRDLLDGM